MDSTGATQIPNDETRIGENTLEESHRNLEGSQEPDSRTERESREQSQSQEHIQLNNNGNGTNESNSLSGSLHNETNDASQALGDAVETSESRGLPQHLGNGDVDKDGSHSPLSPSADGVTNGNGLRRKRSRSGSIKQSTTEAAGEAEESDAEVEAEGPLRETPLDKILLERYLYREWEHAALAATMTPHQKVLQTELRKRDYYIAIQQERRMNPAAVFGAGYEGYGNANTDLKSQHPQLLYPSNRRRPGGRKSRDVRIPREDMLAVSDQTEDLVPIRLDIDWDKIKVRDTFTWNLHDVVTPPEIFAEKLVEDLGLPLESCGPLVRQISQSIHDQLADFYPQIYVEEEALDPHLPYFAYKNDEMRILIKLNITIGQHTLVDQFEWEINNPHNCPESFALQMSTDLSLPGEFTTSIAHSIREQIQLFTKSLYIISYPFDGRPIDDPDLKVAFQPSPISSSFRPFQAAKDFTPYLYELNEAELERTVESISREQRRQKRSVNRRGGPVLPDLKDRQRTIRTMLVSSMIPGTAQSIEETRLFKRSGIGRRGRSTTGQRDGLEDSDLSDSDESSTSSPALSQLMQSGTARTRTMRQASSLAQSAIRGQIGASTNEMSLLNPHETRTSARNRNYREESSDTPDRLIVRLRINPQRLRHFIRELRTKSRHLTGSPRQASPGTPAAKSGSSARGSMGPPSQAHAQGAQTPKRPPPVSLNGVVDAPYPPQPGVPGPPAPQWLVRGLNYLKRSYPDDSFEGAMRYTAVDPITSSPIPNAAVTHPGQKLSYKYFPRIRCNDCPGKLYTPGPAMTVDNFEVHLKNRNHKDNVNRRLARTGGGSRIAPVDSGSVGLGGIGGS